MKNLYLTQIHLKTILSPWYFLLETIFSIAAVRSASRVSFNST